MKRLIIHILFWIFIFSLGATCLLTMGFAGEIAEYGFQYMLDRASYIYIVTTIAGVIMGCVDSKQ